MLSRLCRFGAARATHASYTTRVARSICVPLAPTLVNRAASSSPVFGVTCPGNLICPTDCRDRTTLSTRMNECKDTGCIDCPRQDFDKVYREIIHMLVRLMDWQVWLPPHVRVRDDPMTAFESEVQSFVKVAVACTKVFLSRQDLTYDQVRLGTMLLNLCDIMSRIASVSNIALPYSCKLCYVDTVVDLLAGIVPSLDPLGCVSISQDTPLSHQLLNKPNLSLEALYVYIAYQLVSYRNWLVGKAQ